MRCAMHSPAFGVALTSERVGLLFGNCSERPNDLRYPVLLFLYTTGLDCKKIYCGIGNLFPGYPLCQYRTRHCLSTASSTPCSASASASSKAFVYGAWTEETAKSGFADLPTPQLSPASGDYHETLNRRPSSRVDQLHTPSKHKPHVNLNLNTNSFPLSHHHISTIISEATQGRHRGLQKRKAKTGGLLFLLGVLFCCCS